MINIYIFFFLRMNKFMNLIIKKIEILLFGKGKKQNKKTTTCSCISETAGYSIPTESFFYMTYSQ